MVGSGRVIGLVLIGVAVVMLLGAGIFVFGQMNQTGTQMQAGGAALTMGCALLVAAVVAGFGIWIPGACVPAPGSGLAKLSSWPSGSTRWKKRSPHSASRGAVVGWHPAASARS